MQESPKTNGGQGAIPLSDHFDGNRFFNPGVRTDKGWRDLWRWRRSREPVPWPSLLSIPSSPPPPHSIDADDIAITHIGHATLLIQTAGYNIITDPVFSERASPFSWTGPRRVRPPGVSLDALPRIDVVMLSHNHYDHLDMRTLIHLHQRWKPVMVTGLGNGRYLVRAKIRPIIELDWWESHEIAPELRVTYVPAQHWSHRWPMDRQKALWGGHVVHAPAGSVYFAGDTGYPGDFKGIRERLGSPDIALLPIGAYEPRWFMGAQHMNPDDAVRAHLDLGARLSVAMHWGVFHMTDEAIDAPLVALDTARRAHSVSVDEFRVLDFGERLHLDRSATGESTS